MKDRKKEYYQVAYLLATEDVIEREFGAYKDIQDNYPKYVLSMDRFDFSRDGIIHQTEYDRFFVGKVKTPLTDSKESTILTLIKGSNWRLLVL